MTFITWACVRCVQELATILGSQNPTQRSCGVYVKSGLWIFYGNNETYILLYFREKKFVALKVVKSAAHYTETALDEIKLLKCVS